MNVDYTQAEALDEGTLKEALVDLRVSVGGRPAGTMTFELWPEVAPATVRNFVRYVAEGFYEGKTFHRVMAGFMIQGGCPLGTGTGSGPHGNVPGEFHSDRRYTHSRGVISMARAADPDSASCQFFVCHADADFLDGQYASFGQLVEGAQALDAVAAVDTRPGPGGERSKPSVECRIEAVRVYPRG